MNEVLFAFFNFFFLKFVDCFLITPINTFSLLTRKKKSILSSIPDFKQNYKCYKFNISKRVTRSHNCFFFVYHKKYILNKHDTKAITKRSNHQQ